MEKLLEILKSIDGNVDFLHEERLLEDNILDSVVLLTLVAEIENAFSVRIDTLDVIPRHFNTVEAIWKLIQSQKSES